MQLNKTWKLATGLMVLTLLAMPFAVMVTPSVSASTTATTLSINVFNDDGPLEDATATLTEVRDSSIDAETDTSDVAGLIEFTPVVGYYRLTISADGYYDYVYDDIIRFDGQTNVNLGIAELTETGAADNSVLFNVTSGSTAVPGAIITVQETHDGVTQTVATGTTDSSGLKSISLHDGTFTVVVSKKYYVTKSYSLTVNGDTTSNVSLSGSISYSGTVTVEGSAASDVVAYLVDTSNPLSSPTSKIIVATINSNYFYFDAYAGTFYLLVDADGGLAKIATVTISVKTVTTIALEAQNEQSNLKSFSYSADEWNTMVLTTYMNSTDYDMTVPGMAYSYLPNLRLQIDLALGDGNGILSAAEVALFKSEIESYGPYDVITDDLLTVDTNSMYVSDDDVTYTLTGLAASVTSTNSFTMVSVVNYTANKTIVNGEDDYTVIVYTDKTTADWKYSYMLSLPSGDDIYEMVGNVTSPTTIVVTGYTDVLINASSVKTGYATLTVEISEGPTAEAVVVTGDDAYEVLDNDSELLYYIVSTNVNTTFSASGSEDPNGNPLVYTWKYGDSVVNTTMDQTCVHIYTVAGMYTVNLTVTDQTGYVDYADFVVYADGVKPVIKVTLNDTLVTENITVDQNAEVVFDSYNSTDAINSSLSNGLIYSYIWDWGDGNTTTVLIGENETVTYIWTSSGNFTAYMNATDVANHTTVKKINVTVLDTVAPTVSYTIKYNGSTVTTAVENQTLNFNASASSDASEIVSYFWDFGDGTNTTTAAPNHTYTNIATYKVNLTLTDSAGNVAYKVTSLKITSSARPDIRVNSVDFDPDEFTEGTSGKIYINVTNVGTADAYGIVAVLYKMNSDGDLTKLTDDSELRVNDTVANVLLVDETGIIVIEYSFGSQGDYTLQVNVTATNEHTSVMDDNIQTKSLTVNEAAWKAWLLYGGIFAVVIVVIVLFLFRKKLPKIGGKKKDKTEKTVPAKKK
jgi:PKD repeat protein